MQRWLSHEVVCLALWSSPCWAQVDGARGAVLPVSSGGEVADECSSHHHRWSLGATGYGSQAKEECK